MSGSERRRFTAFLAASAGFHLLVFLIPMAWWQAAFSAGGGHEGQADRGAGPLVVSMIELPAFEPPAEAPAEAPAETPAPETSETIPDPELPALPVPRVEPPEVPPVRASETASGASGAPGGSETESGSGAAGADAAGVPGPGEPEPRFRPPRLLAGALPLTPQESEELDLDGPLEISVRLRVDTEGRVREVVPDDPALPPRLVEALERSAAAMRFVPAKLGGQPVEAWFSMSFVYRR